LTLEKIGEKEERGGSRAKVARIDRSNDVGRADGGKRDGSCDDRALIQQNQKGDLGNNHAVIKHRERKNAGVVRRHDVKIGALFVGRIGKRGVEGGHTFAK